MRPGDAQGWAGLPDHVRDYERARARRHCGDSEVRPEDRRDLDALPTTPR